ncbi:MAG: hypothetical protein ACOC6D_02345 [Atribacterota bacterium]
MLTSIFSIFYLAGERKIIDTLEREVTIPKEISRILAVGSSLREVASFDVVDKVIGIEFRRKIRNR